MSFNMDIIDGGGHESVIYALNRAYTTLSVRKRSILVGLDDFEGNAVLNAMETIEAVMALIYEERKNENRRKIRS